MIKNALAKVNTGYMVHIKKKPLRSFVLRRHLSSATCNKTPSHNALTTVLQHSTIPPVIKQCPHNSFTAPTGSVHLAHTYCCTKVLIVLSTLVIIAKTAI